MARPVPVPDELTQPYWDAVNQSRLLVQLCGNCKKFQHPPEKNCPACGSGNVGYVPVSGRGSVYTYSIVHDTRVRGLMEYQPFPLIGVELEGAPGVVVLSDLVGDTTGLHIGAPVMVDFEQVAPGRRVPLFRLVNSM